jgi:hypothetical protein
LLEIIRFGITDQQPAVWLERVAQAAAGHEPPERKNYMGHWGIFGMWRCSHES